MTPIVLDRASIRAAIARHRDAFAALVGRIPYERKGILYSEMLFLRACADLARPGRILESGRARGQSTLVLGTILPETPIVSVEFDRNSPDVPVAAERLAGHPQVELMFGDATRLLPQLAQPGDIVLIDGPKGYRGIRLALRLLATGRVPLVFVHDTTHGTPERRFLAKALPETVYSDEPEFAAESHALDAAAVDSIPPEHRFDGGPPAAGYGFSLACIPWRPERNYWALLGSAAVDGFVHRVFHRNPGT